MSRTDRTQTNFLTAFVLLWLAGIALRLTILAVPPVIPLIHDELGLSATEIGFLTGLPSMLFALAAVPGSLLIARLGVKAALVVGLALTAIGGALRGALPDADVALCHDDRDGSRRGHHAGDDAAGRARLGPESHRICHRRLHEWPAGRRDLARGVDVSVGFADCRRELAVELRHLESCRSQSLR